ncbi:type I secretion system permease/ATPase [Martelella alba]|uniref:Type I secretion system permease/ATPase n=1 Tax=Martelella alba TaxID=2590451 RepID=A0A506UGY2_9HYPH|nr:type I secretion system permease/ATPase [Martelella alba]
MGGQGQPDVDHAVEPKTLIASLRARPSAFWGVLLFSGMANLLMLTGPVFMLLVYDRVLVTRSIPTLVAIGLIATGLYIAFGLISYARGRVLARLADALETEVAPALFRVEIADSFSGVRSGRYPLSDLSTVRRFLPSSTATALFDLPFVPLFLGLLAILHWSLGLAGLIGAVIVICLALINIRLTRAGVEQATLRGAGATVVLEEARRSSEAITALGMVPNLLARWTSARDGVIGADYHAGNVGARISAISRSFRLFLQSTMLALGAILVINDQASGGVMVSASILLGRALAPIDQSVAGWRTIEALRGAWRRIDTALARQMPRRGNVDLPAPKGHVSVEELVVIPPGEVKPVLQGVGFTLAPGEGLGILGPSASGKSSLARLLVGLWFPASGTVRLDGATLDQWDPDRLGRHIGYLPQDVELIGGTVRDCICRHAEDASDGDVIAAAKAADAHELILRLKNGYMTRLGPGGARLSAGQRQRIGLARALFGNPALLVLDEPNANLDQDGDAALTEAIRRARQRGAAVVVITHRATALAAVDTVLVLKEGRMVAKGPKEAIMRQMLRGKAAPAAIPGNDESIRA